MHPDLVVVRPAGAGMVAALALLLCSGPTAADQPGGSRGYEPRIAPMIEIATRADDRPDRVRVVALVTSVEIRRVEFLLDGEPAAADRKPPFGATIELPADGGSNRLEAIALDSAGREVARDSLVLRPGEAALRVSLADVRPVADSGWIEIAARVEHPPATAIERVDFYRDDRYVASVGESPFRTRIPSTSQESFLRAVALTSDGSLAEDVRVLSQPGGADTLSVRLVELYAMVTNRAGAPVTGLERDRFELRQGASSRPIERFAEGDAVPLSLALLIDSSGSMYDSMARVKQSARDFLGSLLDQGDEALLIDFNARPRLLHPSTGDVEGLLARFDMIRSRGGSAVYDSILFGSLQLERAAGRRALVVLTDGLDSGSRFSAAECAQFGRRLGVPIFTLELGHNDSTQPTHRGLALRRLAETTGGSFHQINSAADIVDAYRAIELQLRGQYLLGFAADGRLDAAQLDALTVSVVGDRLKVRTILGGRVRLMD